MIKAAIVGLIAVLLSVAIIFAMNGSINIKRPVPTTAPCITTEAPTETSTDDPTEEPTEAPTDDPTEAPTAPTEAPTAPTKAPTAASTTATTTAPPRVLEADISIAVLQAVGKTTTRTFDMVDSLGVSEQRTFEGVLLVDVLAHLNMALQDGETLTVTLDDGSKTITKAQVSGTMLVFGETMPTMKSYNYVRLCPSYSTSAAEFLKFVNKLTINI